MCGFSRSSVLFLSAGALVAAISLAPLVSSTARADEKAGTRPGVVQPSKLVVGSPAPEFFPSKWVKGEPVKSFQPGRIYVIEFWATWCPPCKESIPHLTEIQKQFKDNVTIIGMASSERVAKNGQDDRFAKVSQFVKAQGDKMNYTIAFEADRKISKAWMGAAGVNGIPAAFVVGADGKIAWIGDPREPAFEATLKQAVEALGADKKTGETTSDPKKR
ncbi:MAG: TlpA family protein disulfide reductase [Phycisphaerales bacterium]|nr:TlpA family protein disulfide reductase [Phycisphaerales bacterium]